MGWFNKTEEVEEQEEPEFDIREALKGMTEKQLLKLLVLIQWHDKYGLDNELDEFIPIAKED